MRTAAFQELTSSLKGQTFNKQLQSSALSAVMGKEGLWVPRTGGGFSGERSMKSSPSLDLMSE